MLCITLNKVQFFAHHGCYEAEQIIGGRFFVTMKMYTKNYCPCLSDNIEDAINYQKAYQLINTEIQVRSRLLENVVGRIAKTLFNHFPQVEKLKISVEKENPSLQAVLESSAVTLTMTRAEMTELV